MEEIKIFNKQIGIVLNPDTSIYEVEPYLNKVGYVMLMGVNPGFQGQKFIEETLDRIKKIKEMKEKIFIEVDGGVNKKTIKKINKSKGQKLLIFCFRRFWLNKFICKTG